MLITNNIISRHTNGTFKFAVVLIDFDDNKRLGKNYKKEKFDSLFFSTNYWFDSNPKNKKNIHPENHDIFGSLRDFYLNQSFNKLEITGLDWMPLIINPEDPQNPGKPLWVKMPRNKYDYALESNGYTKFNIKDTFKIYAEAQLNIELDSYDGICFLYAGKMEGGALWPNTVGNMYLVSEMNEKEDTQEEGTFLHIGTSVHEFGHVLGAADEYGGNDIVDPDEPKYWELMGYGSTNGKLMKGECPAPFSPGYKIMFGWAIPIELPLTQQNVKIDYSRGVYNYYKIQPSNSNEYFIIERRVKTNYDLYTPYYEDPINSPVGILIWHYAPDLIANHNFVKLKKARITGIDEMYRFPENGISQIISDNTSPSLKLRNGNLSFIELLVQWKNLSTDYAEISILNKITEISSNTSWSQNQTLSVPVKINDNSQLIINPGVIININNGGSEKLVKFYIGNNSRLIINGTETNNVIISSSNSKWGGFSINGSGLIETHFAKISYAEDAFVSNSDLASININHSIIDNCLNKSTFNGSVTINNSTFKDSPFNIYKCNFGSSIKNSLFLSNNQADYGILIDGGLFSFIEISKCTINNFKTALQIGFTPSNSTSNNLTVPSIFVKNNIFSNCNNSISIDNGNVLIEYNNFFNNQYDHNKGNYSKNVDPQFVDILNGNFNLKWGSLCIDGGDPSNVLNDPDGSISDMGAFFYNQTPITPDVLSLNSYSGHPYLTWPTMVPHHKQYNVYATYKLPDGCSSQQIFHVLTNSFTDVSVDIVKPIFANQTVTYVVSAINYLNKESQPSQAVSKYVKGGIWKEASFDSSFCDFPQEYSLKASYPNPFNPITTITYEIPEKGNVILQVFNCIGQLVTTLEDGEKETGEYTVVFDGADLSSGVYYYTLKVNDYFSTQKMILLK